ncbi:MAG: ABC transporter permease [Actinomycetota bacterium]
MTTITETIAPPQIQRRSSLAWAAKDSIAIAVRNLIAYKRIPQLLVFSTIQPVIFVIMFRYVFGGAIGRSLPPGVTYADYLMPGIFVQTVTFGSMAAAIGLANDLKSGLIERFQSLPMARSAVLTGRTLADLARNVFVVFLMSAVGLLVGFRIHNGFAFLVSVLVTLLFGYSLAWIFATIGLTFGDPETAQAAAFPILAPLVFASSAFVPVSSMPKWLQGWANHQPVSVTANAIRALQIHCTNPECSKIIGGARWQVEQSLMWAVLIIAVFGTMAVKRYRKAHTM